MDTTLILTQILGLYLLVMGIAVFLNPKRMEEVIKEAGKSYLFPLFDGALALLFGLIVVLLHNEWSTVPAAIVSLLGWLMVLEGVVMFLLPQPKIERMMGFFSQSSWIPVLGGILTVLGAYLTYVGFFA